MEAHLINLDRRPDRLAEALTQFERTDFAPVRFSAVDGRAAELPPGWSEGLRGALGCSLSHRAILRDCLSRGVEEVAVFEDDVRFPPEFRTRWASFLSNLPSDWDAVLIGGQSELPPALVAPGVVRVRRAGRTHAYLIRGRYLRFVLDGWDNYRGHIDHWWRVNQAEWRVYAPSPFLAGQGAGQSDITGRPHAERWWSRGPKPQSDGGPKAYPRKVRRGRSAIPVERGRVFSHAGDLGDLVYSLCTLRQLTNDEPADLVLYPAPGVVREPWDEEKVERVRPFLLRQPYVSAVRFEDRGRGTVLDKWRRRYRSGLNLADMVATAFGVPHWDRVRPWAEADPVTVAPVVLARSGRYHDRFPWGEVVEKLGGRAVFVGTPTEHEDFVRQFGAVPYHRTETVLDLANVIGGCSLFVGNQSAPRAIAEALKVPVWVEQHAACPNTHFDRPTAWYGEGVDIINTLWAVFDMVTGLEAKS